MSMRKQIFGMGGALAVVASAVYGVRYTTTAPEPSRLTRLTNLANQTYQSLVNCDQNSSNPKKDCRNQQDLAFLAAQAEVEEFGNMLRAFPAPRAK